MKILIVSLSNRGGGAARAVHNLTASLHSSKIDFSLVLFEGEKVYDSTIKLLDSKVYKFIFRLKNKFVNVLLSLFRNPTGDSRSINIFPSLLLNLINKSDADVVHLHWIGAEMISLKQIGMINKPIVWTLHDGWIFNGAEHINPNEFKPYLNLSPNWLIDRYTRFRKIKFLADKPIFFTTPSRWLKEEYESSYFNKSVSSCRVIPNLIDKNKWIGIEKSKAKCKFELPSDKKCILFGANNADTSINKGFLFFKYLIDQLPTDEYCFLVVGNKYEIKTLRNNIVCIGQVATIERMIDAYSAADICLIPSLSENLPYVAIESILCKTPVIAFNTGGMKDIISHKVNGYLVDKFDKDDLICGIKYLATHNFEYDISKTLDCYDELKVLKQYINLYEEIIQSK
jgi:glycosyltransferase involved in cell wall biosynthesis